MAKTKKLKEPKAPKKPKTYAEYGLRKSSVVVGKKPDGTPDRKYVYYSTNKEREEKLVEIRRKYALGITLEEMTVQEWSERWLDVWKANASDTQKAHYKAKLTHDILPTIGSARIKDIRYTDLQKLMNSYVGGKKAQ